MKSLSKNSINEAKRKLAEITESRKNKPILKFTPKYDEVYFEGIKCLD